MSAPAFATFSQSEIDAVRRDHSGAFPTFRSDVVFWGIWAAVIAYVIGSMWFFEAYKLFSASERAWRLLSSFFIWRDMDEWMYGQIYVGIGQTIGMAFLGTFLGSCAALGIGFLGARNTMPFGFLRQVVRRILDVFRGVDQLVWGLVFVRAVGLGPLAGVLAIFISDMGTLSKLYAEAIANIRPSSKWSRAVASCRPVRTAQGDPDSAICRRVIPVSIFADGSISSRARPAAQRFIGFSGAADSRH